MGVFTMPSLGADMDAGTVATWLVHPGDVVQRGDIVAVVETDKSTIEVEIFESGVVEELLVPEGERVAVGTPLARVGAGQPAAGTPAAPAPRARRPAPTNGRRPSPLGGPPTAATAAGSRGRPAAAARRAGRAPAAAGGAPAARRLPPPSPVVTSPVVRHLAERLGVDVHRVVGSGPGGTITRTDVERAAVVRSGRPPATPAAARVSAAVPSPTSGRTVVERGGHRSSPYARRLAGELGVPIAELSGSGPQGAVLGSDVLAASRLREAHGEAPGPPVHGAPTPAPEAAPGRLGAAPRPPGADAETAARQAAMRRAIGNLMARSKREIPHYYLSTTVDMSRAVDWLQGVNLERPVAERIVVPALLVKATARAVPAVPEMNGFVVDGEFRPSTDIHVGVAVSLRGGGVIAPALHDVDRMSVGDVMVALRDLVNRARAGRLRSSEMSDPTITVTNLGELGVDSVFGVIYPPQVALVGFGRVAPRPAVVDGGLTVKPCLTATLSADHRASDGHRGGRFLATIATLLQKPEEL